MVALRCRRNSSAFENRIPVCKSLEMHFIKTNYASFKLLLRFWCKDRLETWDMGFRSRFSIPQRKQQGLEENTVSWAPGSPMFSPSGFDALTLPHSLPVKGDSLHCFTTAVSKMVVKFLDTSQRCCETPRVNTPMSLWIARGCNPADIKFSPAFMLACGKTPKSEYVSGRATDSVPWKPHILELSPSTFLSSQCFTTTLCLSLCPNSCGPWSLILVLQNTVLSRSQDALQLQTIRLLLRPLQLSLGKPWYLSWAFLPGTQKQQPLCLQEHRGHTCLWI